jgi:hypothetical protein
MQKAIRMIGQFLSRVFIAISLAFAVFMILFPPNIVKNVGEMGNYFVVGISLVLLGFGLALRNYSKSR